jgi:hypothetical protein
VRGDGGRAHSARSGDLANGVRLNMGMAASPRQRVTDREPVVARSHTAGWPAPRQLCYPHDFAACA